MKKVNDRLLRWFFGIPGVIDEQVKSEIGKLSVQALIAVFIFEILFNVGISIYAFSGMVKDFESLFLFTMTLHLFLLMGIITFITSFRLQRKGILNQEVATKVDKRRAIKAVFNKYLIKLPMMFLIMWLLITSLDFNGQDFVGTLLSWSSIRQALQPTIVLTIIFMIIDISKVRLMKEES